ncbi:MAG: hypothetical protein CL917_17515 [Deltaproteobacteria bacterium]|nr:hypothetical protein [Deltaproteobacteria bacterium]
MKTFILSVILASIFFVSGFFFGRLTSPESERTAQARLAGDLIQSPSMTEKQGDLAASKPQDTKTKKEILQDFQNDPRLEIARTLANWGGNPTQVVDTVINGMTDDEITVTLSSLTSLKTEDLKDVNDLQQYAKRMAELAVNDLVGNPVERDPLLPEIFFSQEPDPDSAVQNKQTSFDGSKRIHAILPMDNYQGDEVFVKWTNVADPEVMLFDSYPIRADADYNWVYLEPNDGWSAGEYSVDFYSSDEYMTPLGGGNYQIKK